MIGIVRLISEPSGGVTGLAGLLAAVIIMPLLVSVCG